MFQVHSFVWGLSVWQKPKDFFQILSFLWKGHNKTSEAKQLIKPNPSEPNWEQSITFTGIWPLSAKRSGWETSSGMATSFLVSISFNTSPISVLQPGAAFISSWRAVRRSWDKRPRWTFCNRFLLNFCLFFWSYLNQANAKFNTYESNRTEKNEWSATVKSQFQY